jgi:uridine kinase
VLPSAARASVVVEGTDALDWSLEQVLQQIRSAGLLRPAHKNSQHGSNDTRYS